MVGNKSVVGYIWAAVVVLAAIVAVGEAAVYIQLPLQVPDKYACSEGCYSNRFDVMLPTGINVDPIDGTCSRYLCQADGNTQIFTCGAIAVPANCVIVRDLTKPYPDCCGTPVCQYG